MATIALYADKINQMPGLIQDVKKSGKHNNYIFRIKILLNIGHTDHKLILGGSHD